jgi:hypothetical protein
LGNERTLPLLTTTGGIPQEMVDKDRDSSPYMYDSASNSDVQLEIQLTSSWQQFDVQLETERNRFGNELSGWVVAL